MFVAVVRHVKLNLNFPTCFCHAVNGRLVTVSVSTCSTDGSTGRTGSRANAADVRAQRNKHIFFISPPVYHDFRSAPSVQFRSRGGCIRESFCDNKTFAKW